MGLPLAGHRHSHGEAVFGIVAMVEATPGREALKVTGENESVTFGDGFRMKFCDVGL